MNWDMYQAFGKSILQNPYDAVTRQAFADFLDENGRDDEALWHRTWTKERQEAEDRLRELGEMFNISYDELIRGGYKEGSVDATMAFSNFMGPGNSKKYWECWSLVTGESLEDREVNTDPFNCNCITLGYGWEEDTDWHEEKSDYWTELDD